MILDELINELTSLRDSQPGMGDKRVLLRFEGIVPIKSVYADSVLIGTQDNPVVTIRAKTSFKPEEISS